MKKNILFLFILCISHVHALQVLEVPSEICAGTRGASLGPQAIQMSALNKNSDFFKKHPVKTIPVENDCLLDKINQSFAKRIQKFKQVYERVKNEVAESVKNERTIILAGDHSTAAASIAGIKKTFPAQTLGVVWIDAHADFHSPYTTPSGNMHGMPVAIALGQDNLENKRNDVDEKTIQLWNQLKGPKPNVCPSDLVYIAVRDTETQEDDLIRKLNIKNFSVGEVREKGALQCAQEAIDRLQGCDLIYVSFDVDSMDASLSRGTGCPTIGGITNQEADIIMSELLKSPKVCCFEIAEVNPLLDSENKMAEMAFDILQNSFWEPAEG